MLLFNLFDDVIISLILDFNTSNVTIQRFTALKELSKEEFQYI